MTTLTMFLFTARLLTVSTTARTIGRARSRLGRVRAAAEAGMSTAEYAVGTVAAVAFAVVLYKVVRSPAVASALSSIVRSALHTV